MNSNNPISNKCFEYTEIATGKKKQDAKMDEVDSSSGRKYVAVLKDKIRIKTATLSNYTSPLFEIREHVALAPSERCLLGRQIAGVNYS